MTCHLCSGRLSYLYLVGGVTLQNDIFVAVPTIAEKGRLGK